MTSNADNARPVTDASFRYRSPGVDSARWRGFPYRDGDIVISSRSRTGTTWVQVICALLIFHTPELPAPIVELSPWLDAVGVPREDVWTRLAAQEHRRFIKTRTPLDGIQRDPRATYIVTARHPLDSAVSLYHQINNIDRARLGPRTGRAEQPPRMGISLHDWLLLWISADADPREDLESLPGYLWHLTVAWSRREEPNVVLVHYGDLCADLEGQMRRIAGGIGAAVPEETWPALVQAATFESMRGNADRLVPASGVFKSNTAFFRRGSSGAAREVLSEEEWAAYDARAAELAPADMLAWLHSR